MTIEKSKNGYLIGLTPPRSDSSPTNAGSNEFFDKKEIATRLQSLDKQITQLQVEKYKIAKDKSLISHELQIPYIKQELAKLNAKAYELKLHIDPNLNGSQGDLNSLSISKLDVKIKKFQTALLNTNKEYKKKYFNQVIKTLTDARVAKIFSTPIPNDQYILTAGSLLNGTQLKNGLIDDYQVTDQVAELLVKHCDWRRVVDHKHSDMILRTLHGFYKEYKNQIDAAIFESKFQEIGPLFDAHCKSTGMGQQNYFAEEDINLVYLNFLASCLTLDKSQQAKVNKPDSIVDCAISFVAKDTSETKLIIAYNDYHTDKESLMLTAEFMHKRLVTLVKIREQYKKLTKDIVNASGQSNNSSLSTKQIEFAEMLINKYGADFILTRLSIDRLTTLVATETNNIIDKIKGHLPTETFSDSVARVSPMAVKIGEKFQFVMNGDNNYRRVHNNMSFKFSSDMNLVTEAIKINLRHQLSNVTSKDLNYLPLNLFSGSDQRTLVGSSHLSFGNDSDFYAALNSSLCSFNKLCITGTSNSRPQNVLSANQILQTIFDELKTEMKILFASLNEEQQKDYYLEKKLEVLDMTYKHYAELFPTEVVYPDHSHSKKNTLVDLIEPYKVVTALFNPNDYHRDGRRYNKDTRSHSRNYYNNSLLPSDSKQSHTSCDKRSTERKPSYANNTSTHFQLSREPRSTAAYERPTKRDHREDNDKKPSEQRRSRRDDDRPTERDHREDNRKKSRYASRY